MSESGVGVSVAATRQNAGRAGIGGPSGGRNAPAGKDSAIVTIVFDSFDFDRLAQLPAKSGKHVRVQAAAIRNQRVRKLKSPAEAKLQARPGVR